MCTLAHVFEAAGLVTVGLGSIREQMVKSSPPRGLYCNFPLGRPLGKPGDAQFQHQVLAHAFSMLSRIEPGVEEFSESINDDGTEVLSCPLPPRHDLTLHPALDEAQSLRSAYDRAISQYGNRAATGRTVDADGIPSAIEAFVRVAEGMPWKKARIPGIPARVAQDIRGYYEAAALVMVSQIPPAWAATRWFCDVTVTGQVIRAAQQSMKEAGVRRDLWIFLLPSDS